MTSVPDLFDVEGRRRRIEHVYRLDDGRVVVFDQNATPMQEYCGTWAEKEAEIRRNMPPTAKVHE